MRGFFFLGFRVAGGWLRIGCGWLRGVVELIELRQPALARFRVALDEVPVALEGEARLVVPELLRDVQQLNAVLQELARVAVADVVNPHLPQLSRNQKRLEHPLAEVVGVAGVLAVAEHPGIQGTGQVGFERRLRLGVDGDHALEAVRPQLAQHGL
ncbi:hypothetical protein KF840_05880 [bacterium]|nr:hypothetical protein [bacterium]